MINENIDLSIIIPVYNTEKYIEECLESIMDINISNYEVIIIDDGSTDSSASIIKKYSESFKNVHYRYQENMGQGSARNYGVSISKGKYVYFMDSDDIICSSKFTEVFNNLYNSDLDAIFFDGKSFLDTVNNEGKSNFQNFNYIRSKKYGNFETGEKLFIDLFSNRDFIISPCLYIVKRDIYIINNLEFPVGMKHEDEVFTMKLFFFVGNCRHVNEILFLRRVRLNSTMTTVNYSNTFVDHVKVLMYLDTFYRDFNFTEQKSKEFFSKKMRNIYILGLKIYRKVDSKKLQTWYETLTEIGKKYNYFDVYGKFATKNIVLFDMISKFILQKRRKEKKI